MISDLRLGSCMQSCSDIRKSEAQPGKYRVAYKILEKTYFHYDSALKINCQAKSFA